MEKYELLLVNRVPICVPCSTAKYLSDLLICILQNSV